MTIENGAAQAANDTASSNAAADAAAAAATAANNTQDTSGADNAVTNDKPGDDEEDFDLDGERFRIPRKLREAIAKPMLGDYTRKTQELAEGRKAFETERQAFEQEQAVRRTHFENAAKVYAFNNQLAEMDKAIGEYGKVNWAQLAQVDNASYQQHRANLDMLRDQREALRNQRDTAARDWTTKEQEYASNTNRERGERVSKAQAEIAKLVEGWAPGNELDLKLGAYGNGLGFSNSEMAELATRNPKFVQQLNRLRLFDERDHQQQKQQQFQQSQQAKPVTRVGGAGGSGASRKTTDASGDALTTDEWVRRERERLRNRNKR